MSLTLRKFELLLLVVFISMPMASADTSLRYIDSGSRWPYVYRAGEGLDGFLPRSLKLAADAQGVTLNILTAEDRRALDQVTKRLADATFVVVYQGKNIHSVGLGDYPDHLMLCESPLYSGNISLLMRKNVALNKSPASMRVGMLRVVHFEQTRVEEATPSRFINFTSSDSLIKSLVAGRIDALLGDPDFVNPWYSLHSSGVEPLVIEAVGQYSLHLALHKSWQRHGEGKQKFCELMAKASFKEQSASILQSILSSPPRM